MAAKTVVTISRQLGSGGSQIGQMVATRLGFHYADREILERACHALFEDSGRRMQMRPEDVAWREERLSSSWDRLALIFPCGPFEAPYFAPPLSPILDEALYAQESRIIKALAEHGRCVIVGRGGAHLLRDRPDALHVLLHAPIGFRIGRTMEHYGAKSADEAKSMIEESDRSREKFFRWIDGHEWLNATNYHLSFDTSAAPFEAIADAIASLAGGSSEAPIHSQAAGESSPG